MTIQSKSDLKNNKFSIDSSSSVSSALQSQNMFSAAAMKAAEMVASNTASDMPAPSTSRVVQAASHAASHDISPGGGLALVTTRSEEGRMIAASNAARANRRSNLVHLPDTSPSVSEVPHTLPQLTFSLSEEGRMMNRGLAAFNNRQAGGTSVPEAGPSAWRMIRTQTFVSPPEGALPSQYIQQQRAGHSRSASMYSTSSSHIHSPMPLRNSSSQGSSGRASGHISISSMPGGTVITGITRDDMQVPAIAYSTVVVQGQDGGYRALSRSEPLSSFVVQARTPAPQGTSRELTLQSFFRLADQTSSRRSISGEQSREDYFTLSPEVSRIADRRAQNIYISDQEVANLYQQMAQKNKAAPPREILSRIFGAEGRGTWKDGLVNKYLPLYQSGDAVPTPPRLGDQSALSSQGGLSVASSGSWGLPMGPPRADMRGSPLIEFIQAAALRRSNNTSQASTASSNWGLPMGPPREAMPQNRRSQASELANTSQASAASSDWGLPMGPPAGTSAPSTGLRMRIPPQPPMRSWVNPETTPTPVHVSILSSYVPNIPPGARLSDINIDLNQRVPFFSEAGEEMTLGEFMPIFDDIVQRNSGANRFRLLTTLFGVPDVNGAETHEGRMALLVDRYYTAWKHKDELAQREAGARGGRS